MARSMTGFGRAKIEGRDLEFIVEIKTLNHRYLDINMRLPKVVSFLEEDIRGRIQEGLDRGRIEVYIQGSPKTGDKIEVQLNKPLVESYIGCFEYLTENYNIKPDISLSALTGIQDLFQLVEKEQDEEIVKGMVLTALDEALGKVLEMRNKEGYRLGEDIIMRGRFIRDMVEAIETRAPEVVDEYRAKLNNRVRELIQATEFDEARFNTEVVLFADRSNVTEEIIRLKSHLEQLGEILKQRGAIGRKLDFLVQEMNREANTIGSKANDLNIINLVVDIKSEIEKIKEQVQNIE